MTQRYKSSNRLENKEAKPPPKWVVNHTNATPRIMDPALFFLFILLHPLFQFFHGHIQHFRRDNNGQNDLLHIICTELLLMIRKCFRTVFQQRITAHLAKRDPKRCKVFRRPHQIPYPPADTASCCAGVPPSDRYSPFQKFLFQ